MFGFYNKIICDLIHVTVVTLHIVPNMVGVRYAWADSQQGIGGKSQPEWLHQTLEEDKAAILPGSLERTRLDFCSPPNQAHPGKGQGGFFVELPYQGSRW